ncbi:MAG: type II toxin-antitoxin system HicA family toxin [Dehalococcoidia bacterium]|nr:type II toxin-antitoxin system HicA family toxin [Dehalococcoidia bacterium]
MARRERRIERLRRSQTDVSPEQLRTALESVGFTLVNVTGSHYRYSHPDLVRDATIPYRRPLKRIYVQNALKAIDEVTSDDDN